MMQYPPYEWTDWSVDDISGIELWNQMSEWMEGLTRWNRLAMAFSPRKSMIGPSARTFKWFDDINARRKCVGVASVDAHEFPVKVGPFTVPIFSYKVHFHSLRTYLLLAEPLAATLVEAKRQVYDALSDCRVFGANVRWGNADGFEFSARSKSEKVVVGGTITTAADVHLEVRLPGEAEIRLIHNGTPAVSTISDRLVLKVDQPGLYRVEAWRKSRCWIFSNHIRVSVPSQGER
jgi:hypothetical protein